MLFRSSLAQIIRFYGHAMQGVMGNYLEKNLQAFVDMQGRLAEQASGLYDPKSFTLFSYGTLNLGAGVSISDVFSIDYSGFKDENGNVARADWFTISNDTGAGAIVLTAIPEPSTYGLAIGALALAAAALRRRRKQNATDASAQ